MTPGDKKDWREVNEEGELRQIAAAGEQWQ